MRRSTLAICALLTVATFGCDQVNAAKDKLKLAWDKIRGRQTATRTPPPPIRPAPDTAAAREASRRRAAPAHHQRRKARWSVVTCRTSPMTPARSLPR